MAKKENCFQLVHNKTGLPFGEHKMQHPLRYFSDGPGGIYIDNYYAKVPVLAICRTDGVIGFQRLTPQGSVGESHFLLREDWTVQWKDEI
jgi:hypothetical protein